MSDHKHRCSHIGKEKSISTSVDLILLLISKSYMYTILFILLQTSFHAAPALFPLQAWRKKMSQEKAWGEN